MVQEGQHVEGQRSSCSRSTRRRSALRTTQAKSKLAGVRTDFANLKTNLALAHPARRFRAAERRDQEARRRSQDLFDRQQAGGHAGRSSTTSAFAASSPRRLQAQLAAQQAQRYAQSAARAIPICQSSNFRPSFRPRPRSIRPSAISTTPCCARRSTAPPRRSTHPAWPLRHRWHADVQHHRRYGALGRRQPERDRHHLSAVGQQATVDVDSFPDTPSPARCSRSAPAPARNSRSFRRRTPAATGSRSCSACRSASRSIPADGAAAARRHERLCRDRHQAQPLRSASLFGSPAVTTGQK